MSFSINVTGWTKYPYRKKKRIWFLCDSINPGRTWGVDIPSPPGFWPVISLLLLEADPPHRNPDPHRIPPVGSEWWPGLGLPGPGKWPRASEVRPDPVSAASGNALAVTFPEASATRLGDTAQHPFLLSNRVSFSGSRCLFILVPSSIGLSCQGSEVLSWGLLTCTSSLYKAPRRHLWAADCSPLSPRHVRELWLQPSWPHSFGEAWVQPGPQVWGHSWVQTRFVLVTRDVALDKPCTSQGLPNLPICPVGVILVSAS